jgi:hypothetical protein
MIGRGLARIALLSVGLVLVACTGVLDSDGEGLTVRTDQDTYVATPIPGSGIYQRYRVRVITHFRNPGPRALYLGRCDPEDSTPMYGVGLEGDASGQASAFNVGWLCVGSLPIRVEPGEERTDTLYLSGPNFSDATGQVRGEVAGRMRLSYSVARCPDNPACWLEKAGRSNVFTVTVGS